METDFDYSRRIFSTLLDSAVKGLGEENHDNSRMKKGQFNKDRLHEALVLRQVPRNSKGKVRNADAARYLGVNPQTAYNWLDKSGTRNISAADLFFLGDKLKVNTRWLMGLTDDPTPGITLGPDERRVLAVFTELQKLDDKTWAEDWVADGYKILHKLGVTPSPAVPYPKRSTIRQA